MSAHDPAFQWETEALRESAERRGQPVGREPSSAPDAAPPRTGGEPPGTMIVPIEAWEKMLMQLGNLHEAGQQLAEASERSARAETEALFLRERLAELRVSQPTPAVSDTGVADGDQAERVAPTSSTDDNSSGGWPPPGILERAGRRARVLRVYAARRWNERRRRRT